VDECKPLAGGQQRLKRCGTCPAGGDPLGTEVQVDPMKPKLKGPGTLQWKLKCDVPLSTSAFEFNLRHYTSERTSIAGRTASAQTGWGGAG
jgi:hypothetical protein